MIRQLLILFLFALNAGAAHKYVRTASQGSATGADWSNAWSIANLNANWASVSAGDTIWLAAGTYTTGINADKSGSAGNYITITRPLTTDSVPTAAAGWSAGFDGQVDITPTSDAGIEWGGNNVGNYVYVDGRTTNGIMFKHDNTADAFLGAVYFSGSNIHDVVLTNLNMSGPGTASAFNYLGDNAALCFTGSSGNISNIMVSYCTIQRAGNLIRGTVSTIRFITIDHCVLKDNISSNGDVHANVIYNEGMAYWTIRYCDISNWEVEGIILWEIGNDNAPWYVHGNVFRDPASGNATCFWPGADVNTPQGPLFLYNNTFVDCAITSGQSRSWDFSASSISRNNIFWNSSFTSNSDFSGASENYNFSDVNIGGANSIDNGSNPFVNEASNDFRIIETVSATLARNKGTTVTDANEQVYSVDGLGATRGSDGTWDMGAFEFGAAVPVVTDLQIIGRVSLTGKVTVQ